MLPGVWNEFRAADLVTGARFFDCYSHSLAGCEKR